MPRSLGATVPQPLRPLLDGRRLDAVAGQTFLLLTAAADDWPHAALLSAGEILLRDEKIRLALWPGSTTTANLTAGGLATLLVVVPPAVYDLRLRAARRPDLVVAGRPRAFFEAEVIEALEDVVGYATVTAGVSFELANPATTLAAWSECLTAMSSAEP